MLNQSDLHIIGTRTAKGETKGKCELTSTFKQTNERKLSLIFKVVLNVIPIEFPPKDAFFKKNTVKFKKFSNSVGENAN